MRRVNDEWHDTSVFEEWCATKRKGGDLDLRRSERAPLTREFLESLPGIGWDGDLASMRAGDQPQ